MNFPTPVCKPPGEIHCCNDSPMVMYHKVDEDEVDCMYIKIGWSMVGFLNTTTDVLDQKLAFEIISMLDHTQH